MELTPIAYLLEFDSSRLEEIKIEATLYDKSGKPISWAIRKGGMGLSKITNNFHIERLPSSRDRYYYKEFRFESEKEALTFWNKREN